MSVPLFFFRRLSPVTSEITITESKAIVFLQKIPAISLTVTWSLYDQPETSPFVTKISKICGPIIAFSWQSARATTSLLKKMAPESMPVSFDLSELNSNEKIEECLKKVREICQKSHLLPDTENIVTANVELDEIIPAKRWYPIIDPEKCISCLECVNFCLFGVYTIGNENHPLVVKPDSCRDGCPACSRVCPAGAIIFPEYDDPIISGRTAEETIFDAEKPILDETIDKKQKLDDLIDQIGQFDL